MSIEEWIAALHTRYARRHILSCTVSVNGESETRPVFWGRELSNVHRVMTEDLGAERVVCLRGKGNLTMSYLVPTAFSGVDVYIVTWVAQTMEG